MGDYPSLSEGEWAEAQTQKAQAAEKAHSSEVAAHLKEKQVYGK